MKANAAVLAHIGKPLELCELDVPSPKKGQVLVQLAYSGFCHSQLNEIKGLKGPDPFLPHTLGHEGSGIVLEIGESVEKVQTGDHVVLSWLKGRGADVPSSQYNSARFGKVNSGAISTFLSYALISENRVIPIPKTFPLREAALLGCAMPTGAGVVRHEMKLKEGNSFALFGAGGVGLSALLAAKSIKANPIIVVDVTDNKLEIARKLGATHLISVLRQDPIETILRITEGRGADFVFESAGKQEAMEKAFAVTKAPGGVCVLAGNLPKGEKIAIDPFDLIRGKQLIGTWGGKSAIDSDVAHYVACHESGKLDISSLITHEVELQNINDLMKEIEKGCVGRGLINFTHAQ